MDIEQRAGGLMEGAQWLAVRVKELRASCNANTAQPYPIRWEGDCRAEVLSNLTLALRHLEDAQSRLERAWCLLTPIPPNPAGPAEKFSHDTSAN